MRWKLSRASLVCLALLSFPAGAWAQTVDEIVAKNLEAKGGLARLRETTSVRITGTMTMAGAKGATVTMSKRPNLFRREMEVGGQKMVQGFDGTTLWMRMGTMGAQEMPPGPQTDALKRNVDFDAAFIDWQKKGHQIDFKGKVTEGGREYYHLAFTPKDGPPIDYYIDPATGLEAKTVMEDPATKGKMETRLTDYRTIDGRMIPFVMTNLLNGSQVAQIRLERVEFNVPLDDALFRMPK